jgi:hypothetical protein
MWNIPDEQVLKKIPRLYETDQIEAEEKLIYLHFFLAGSDWFIAEYDGEDTFFGFVCLNGMKEFSEWGYISFQELKDLRVKQPILINGVSGMVLLEVERDKYWKVRKVREVSLICECQRW